MKSAAVLMALGTHSFWFGLADVSGTCTATPTFFVWNVATRLAARASAFILNMMSPMNCTWKVRYLIPIVVK